MTQEEISKAFVNRTHDAFFYQLGRPRVLYPDYSDVVWAGYLFLKYGDAKWQPVNDDAI